MEILRFILIYCLKFKMFIRINFFFIQEVNRTVLQNVAALPFQDNAIINSRLPRNIGKYMYKSIILYIYIYIQGVSRL